MMSAKIKKNSGMKIQCFIVYHHAVMAGMVLPAAI